MTEEVGRPTARQDSTRSLPTCPRRRRRRSSVAAVQETLGDGGCWATKHGEGGRRWDVPLLQIDGGGMLRRRGPRRRLRRCCAGHLCDHGESGWRRRAWPRGWCGSKPTGSARSRFFFTNQTAPHRPAFLLNPHSFGPQNYFCPYSPNQLRPKRNPHQNPISSRTVPSVNKVSVAHTQPSTGAFFDGCARRPAERVLRPGRHPRRRVPPSSCWDAQHSCTFLDSAETSRQQLLSLGGILVLINSVLTNMVLYMISFFQLPKGVLHRLDYFRSRFFWQGDNKKQKYRLAKWDVVCRPKDHGGLGIHDLQVKNRALLGKWLFKLLTEQGVWQTLLRRKYVGFCSKALSQIY